MKIWPIKKISNIKVVLSLVSFAEQSRRTLSKLFGDFFLRAFALATN